MTDSAPIRILLADDHPLMRSGIALTLNRHGDIQIVAEAADGQEAVEAFRKHRPDVTLMDLQMPHMNGLEAIKIILGDFPGARIIVLTTDSGDISASRALEAGAAAYLLKTTWDKELVDTIRTVHRGQRFIPPEVASLLAEHIGSGDISDREMQVLRGVARGHSNKIIADELSISEATVKAHLKSIFAKLQANDRTQAVLIAIKRGFIDS